MDPWQAFLSEVYSIRSNAPGTESRPHFYPPVSLQEFQSAESLLKQELPMELAELLRETNGVMEELSVDGRPYFDNLWLAWPIEQMLAENRSFRSPNASENAKAYSENILLFSAAGVDGILFGLNAHGEVVAWSPMREEFWGLADTLRDFFRGWLCGEITV